MKPKSAHKQAATHNRDTKQTTEHKKEKPKTQPQDLFHPSKITHLFRSDWYQGQAIAPRWCVDL
jgi:hypothetical protein